VLFLRFFFSFFSLYTYIFSSSSSFDILTYSSLLSFFFFC
jgi:hypothetical protein